MCEQSWRGAYYAYYIMDRAIRTVNTAGYCEHSNALFLKSHALKFMDLVEFKTAQIMYKEINNLLPSKIKKKFSDREGVII